MGSRKINKGFTLIEIVVSLTIVILFLFPLIHTFIYGSKIDNRIEERITGVLLCQRDIEYEVSGIFDIKDTTYTEIMNKKEWKISRRIYTKGGYKVIEVQVFKKNGASAGRLSLVYE